LPVRPPPPPGGGRASSPALPSPLQGRSTARYTCVTYDETATGRTPGCSGRGRGDRKQAFGPRRLTALQRDDALDRGSRARSGAISGGNREKHMKRYSLVVATLIGVVLLAAPQVMAQGIVEGFRACPGEFALCAASTCTPTGNQIDVNTEGGTASFPEAMCTCPIFPGPGLADVNGGN